MYNMKAISLLENYTVELLTLKDSQTKFLTSLKNQPIVQEQDQWSFRWFIGNWDPPHTACQITTNRAVIQPSSIISRVKLDLELGWICTVSTQLNYIEWMLLNMSINVINVISNTCALLLWRIKMPAVEKAVI